MGDIYQDIWNADQAANGIEPIPHTALGDSSAGFVKVNAALAEGHRELRVLPEVVIPPAKQRTYDLCKKLFNNYRLPESDFETDTPEERREVHDLVEAIVTTPPMEVAREYVQRGTGTTISRERWHATIVEMWFRRFAQGGDPALSGFEHVVVGEQEGPKVQGYHFWWKYFLDDGFARQVDGDFARFPGLRDDRIEYLGSKQKDGQIQFPESVTISYRWLAPDHEAEAIRPLTKRIGGFFVGCSVEGLLALGTVRAHLGVRAPRVAVIEGARYDMKLFHSNNKQHVRTFYPVFLGPSDPSDGSGCPDGVGPQPDVPPTSIRIVAALINPSGHDPGRETVTIVNTAGAQQPVTNWEIVDRNGQAFVFSERIMEPGEFLTTTLSGADAQLSNKGGEILLKNGDGAIVHRVTYSKTQARNQGQTVLF